MSKKPRPKKKYRPRAVSVPPYLNSFETQDQSNLGTDHDRTFLLQVANRTVDESELALQCRLMQAAWLLAENMENTKELRKAIFEGISAVGAYLSDDHQEFTQEAFEMLAIGVDTCRAILQTASRLERTQAMAAVLSGREKNVGIEGM